MSPDNNSFSSPKLETSFPSNIEFDNHHDNHNYFNDHSEFYLDNFDQNFTMKQDHLIPSNLSPLKKFSNVHTNSCPQFNLNEKTFHDYNTNDLTNNKSFTLYLDREKSNISKMNSNLLPPFLQKGASNIQNLKNSMKNNCSRSNSSLKLNRTLTSSTISSSVIVKRSASINSINSELKRYNTIEYQRKQENYKRYLAHLRNSVNANNNISFPIHLQKNSNDFHVQKNNSISPSLPWRYDKIINKKNYKVPKYSQNNSDNNHISPDSSRTVVKDTPINDKLIETPLSESFHQETLNRLKNYNTIEIDFSEESMNSVELHRENSSMETRRPDSSVILDMDQLNQNSLFVIGANEINKKSSKLDSNSSISRNNNFNLDSNSKFQQNQIQSPPISNDSKFFSVLSFSREQDDTGSNHFNEDSVFEKKRKLSNSNLSEKSEKTNFLNFKFGGRTSLNSLDLKSNSNLNDQLYPSNVNISLKSLLFDLHQPDLKN
ncbi:uncharacterized protein ASCRUDRAFT_72515 [Ascoidea rubescens DSM 1968]|uniref:Uncharacterized protein n=1 Tax=Ascoidea rubescens DSM 1968 TaxID=1344418 RepID=A0A1D2VAX2_9ASCO|nr:hypothetical protein ASCRUDRAFT_72515 [Ascoidea rubescens DSM 1968]ODV58587.1 hypothetical protein ASCRUDRAFT_72515 [Ascoidea rubescens DSM 1968]